MQPHLILRVHSDLRSGLGHVARALVLQEQWRVMGGLCTLAISGDEWARRVGSGRHPILDEGLPIPVVDLGGDAHAPIPHDLKSKATVVLVDQWEIPPGLIQDLRPLKIALMEDDGDAHEQADLLFQPFLEGVHWPNAPVKNLNGRKIRPYETTRGQCKVLRGSAFVVVSPVALQQRSKREPLQPLSVHKLLVSFGVMDGDGLARQAHEMLSTLVKEGRWSGTCTLLAPRGLDGSPFAGCRVIETIPYLTRRLQDYDAIWCTGGVTLAEAICLGVPAVVWAQSDRQLMMLGDLARANGCFHLGNGSESERHATEDALVQWLGPEGQETRQEQTRDGRQLIDGMGASRIAQELWTLANA
jgi:spore coat polysaccharide biosynthesis predicted glycosyltransferase SpsG